MISVYKPGVKEDTEHSVGRISGYSSNVELHRFRNGGDVEYSAIYLDGNEIMSCPRRNESEMIKAFRQQCENLANSGIVKNAIFCKNCKEIVESKGVHDYRWCKCQSCAADGGYDYLKRSGGADIFIDVSEINTQRPQLGDWIHSVATDGVYHLDDPDDVEIVQEDKTLDFATVFQYIANRDVDVATQFIYKFLRKKKKPEDIKALLEARLTPELHDFLFEGEK